MAIATPAPWGWSVSTQPVGPLPSLLDRLHGIAAGAGVALGIDCPIGLPRAYAARYCRDLPSFPMFLATLPARPDFLKVADVLEDVSAQRPFYPRRGLRGMTRLSHALALGLEDARALSRACDRATLDRPAGAPLFWTLGANQSGKAAISAWRDVLLPALASDHPVALWPFDGPLLPLLKPCTVVVAETYPADALRQLGMRPIGSKRRQSDRQALAPGIRSAMDDLHARPDAGLDTALAAGFGPGGAGEDRLDCVLGVLCVLSVLAGRRPDRPPEDPWITQWEGWVLGQSANAGPS